MTDLRTAAQQALEALESGDWYINQLEQIVYSADDAGTHEERAKVQAAMTALRAALAQQAEPVLQTCNCRWDGEVQVQQCTLHEAHIDAIHEWAERANVAERKLAQQAEPVEPVAWMYTGIKQDGTEHGPHLVWKPEYMDAMSASKGAKATSLYTAPPQRLPLTEEEIEQEYKKGYADGYAAGYDNGDSEGFTRGTDSMVPASLAAWRAETKPLTEAQIYAAIKGIDSLKAVEVARAIERAHGIGGQE